MPHAPSLRLYFLGVFRIERDTRPIALPTRKVQALLAYLALFPEPHPREQLAALLWGDSPDEQARHSLRTALATLRSKLGDDILLADRETVQLNPDYPLWVDAREFQQSLTSDLQSAIELYQSDLLPDFYDDWVLVERERLRQLYLDTLLHLVQEMRSQSQYTRAAEFAHRVLATEPTSEAAYQHLMFCYAATGDRIGALKQYDECEKKLRDELGVEPSSETVALREQIERELTGAPSHEALLTNVPTPLTSFIGRQSELAEIKQLLATTRLLTLTGAGGCGKTRLAIQVATDLAGRDGASPLYKHGVWWGELAALSDPAFVPQKVAQIFELPELPGVPIMTTLTNYLRSKELLLVLDNCEHLIEACAQLAKTLLSACPKLQILATSREALGLTGEVTWRVPSLSLPDPAHLPSITKLTEYEAVQLFVERAASALPGFTVTLDSVPAVVQVCHQLDGMPLAIELAAARVRLLRVEDIATRLHDRFRLLTEGCRTALPRHRTLRAAMDWSYELLSDRERTLLQRLAVFAGGWTLEAAEAVCPSDGIKPYDVLDLLAQLEHKSLVHVEYNAVEHPQDQTRYRLLETIRQYAAEKLAQSPDEADALRDRHCAYYAAALQQWAADLKGSRQIIALAEMEADIENARAAWDWAVRQGQVERLDQAIDGLGHFNEWRGHFQEGEQACQAAVVRLQAEELNQAPADQMRVWAKMLAWQSAFSRVSGHYDLARQLLQQSLALLDDPVLAGQDVRPASAFGLYQMGLVVGQSDGEAAKRLYQQSLALYQAPGEQWGEANVLERLGGHLAIMGAFDEGKQFQEESLAIRRSLGDRQGIASSLVALAYCISRQPQVGESERLAREGIAVYREIGDRAGVASGLLVLGKALSDLGKFAEAHLRFEKCAAISDDLGMRNLSALANSVLGIMKVHLGLYEQAHTLLQAILPLFREYGDQNGIGINLLGLGELALAQEEYAQAHQFLQESVTLLNQSGERDQEAEALAELGHAAFALGQHTLARQHLHEALRRATDETITMTCAALPLAKLALLLAHQGEVERAVELYALASRYPYLSCSRYYEDTAGKHIARLAASLPADIATAARTRGQQRDLAATVAELLAEFKSSNDAGASD